MRDLVNQSLDVVDVSTWTGDPLDANFISGQLRLLYENIAEARSTLKGDADTSRGQWWETSADDNVCELFHVGIAYVELAYADKFQKRCSILPYRHTSHSIFQLQMQLLSYT